VLRSLKRAPASLNDLTADEKPQIQALPSGRSAVTRERLGQSGFGKEWRRGKDWSPTKTADDGLSGSPQTPLRA
jgi:hypothetical protein